MRTEPEDFLPLAPRLSRLERAAVLLALGAPSTTTGRALGVNSSTVRRWRQRPDFAADVGLMRLRLIRALALDLTPGLEDAAASPRAEVGE